MAYLVAGGCVGNLEMPEEKSRIEIDLQRKESEAGWIAIQDRFSLAATPVWFTWISWIFILAALDFLYKQSNSTIIFTVIAFSYGMLWLYFNATFYQFSFKNFPFLHNISHNRSASIVLSGFLAWAFWNFAFHISSEISRFQK